MNICLFKPEELNQPLSIRDERGEHIIKILHKKEGDTFSAGVINGMAGTAVITKIEEKQIYFTFKPETEGKPLYPLKMIIGFPRPIQLKRLLRDIAALGVCEVHLTGTELGEKSYMQSNLVEHGTAYQMLVDGTVQAASTHVPELFLHKTLPECLEYLENENTRHCQEHGDAAISGYPRHCERSEAISNRCLKLCLDNINPAGSLMNVFKFQEKRPESVIAAIGSERGWTQHERELLEQTGYLRVGMGPRVMRTETAATVSASIIGGCMGWLD